MPKQIIIAEQHRLAAVFSSDQIQELVVATGSHQVSDIYLGVVENVLPGIDAAFVNIGDAERNGFIHVTDLGPLRLRRTSGAITELLMPQQKVLVQVMKEPTGNKGPRLTGNITLPGRYLVLMPYGRGVNLSRRIVSENERNRLRALAILIKPAGMGLLVRTEAEGMAEEAIMDDLEFLQKQWETIQLEASSTKPPALLNRDDDFIQRVLRDMYSSDVNRIVVDSQTAVKRVKQQVMMWNGGKAPQGILVDHHRERANILEYFRVNAAIREALKPRVDLPSGGYIIIEPTEALTVIDVNSGSFTKSSTARETVLWTNCEAATEIARQLRLRNIAGVIVVDFIDMDSRRDQLQVLEHFNKVLSADKARPQIAQLSELGLVELTRKRQGQNIYEIFGQTCPSCNGLGHLLRLPGESESSPQAIIDRSAMPASHAVPELRRAGNGAPILPGDQEDRVPQENLSDPGLRLDPNNAYDAQELDLTNHPSYQERGVLNNNRRRRRRIGVNGESEAPAPPLLDKGASDREEGQFPEAKDDWEEKAISTERLSPRLRRQLHKATVEPKQVIEVEMTPLEQDVYALMGISPLMLKDRNEVKNPKSAIVSVTLPGQSRVSTASQSDRGEADLTEMETGSDENITSSAPVIEESVTDDEAASGEMPEVENAEVTPSSEIVKEQSTESETGQEDSEAEDADSEVKSEPDVRRRRRRRSSAIE
ncbi:MAG: Rne/Rng family ribonuclease [Hormoscilla sp. GM7CHS1pb]|nr:Rne/Rng family ribonuclease [Hormoscilla sp. GM7CHS1pb]